MRSIKLLLQFTKKHGNILHKFVYMTVLYLIYLYSVRFPKFNNNNYFEGISIWVFIFVKILELSHFLTISSLLEISVYFLIVFLVKLKFFLIGELKLLQVINRNDFLKTNVQLFHIVVFCKIRFMNSVKNFVFLFDLIQMGVKYRSFFLLGLRVVMLLVAHII